MKGGHLIGFLQNLCDISYVLDFVNSKAMTKLKSCLLSLEKYDFIADCSSQQDHTGMKKKVSFRPVILPNSSTNIASSKI